MDVNVIDQEQEKIFTEIYTECDNSNTNNVQVSVLLSFIGPFIDSSSLHFEELKNSLDPTNANPCIDKQTFLNAMISWTEKFKDEVDFNFNNEEISRQSTPTKNLRVDYTELNLSSISAYSLTGSVISTIDPNVLQEQNNELQHQNKKLTECLEDVKYQLQSLEEQNVSLQNQIDVNYKNLQSDQKLIKTLQFTIIEYEKEREEHTKVLHQNKELENRIKHLENQNKTNIETIEKQNDLLRGIDEENEKLHKQINERDAEMLCIQEREREWRQKCTQNEFNLQNSTTEINELKNQIEALENEAKKQAPRNECENTTGSGKMENSFAPDQLQDQNQDQQEIATPQVVENKSISLSPEEDELLAIQIHQQPRQQSPHESLQSELSNISNSSGCFNSCEYRINQLEDEIGKLYDELRSKGGQLTQYEQQLAIARNEIQALNDKYNIQTTESQQLKLNIEMAEKQKQQLMIEKKQMTSKLSYYKVINKNFKAQLDRKSNEVVTMREKFEKLKCEIEEQLLKINKEILTKTNENKIKNEEIHKIENSLRASVEEAKELKEINCKLMNEISSLERAAKLERKRNTRIDLNCKINKLEEELETVKSKNEELQATCRSVSSEKQQLLSKTENLEFKLHTYRKKLTDLENYVKDYECLDGEHKKLQENYDQLITHIENVKATINTNNNLLKSTTYYTSDVWKVILNLIFPNMNLANLLNSNESNNLEVDDGPLKNEINSMNNEISVTITLLKTFATIKNKMIMNECSAEANETATATTTKTTNNIIIKKLFNNPQSHESASTGTGTSFLSKITPKRFSLRAPCLQLKPKPKNKTHFVFPPPMSPQNHAELNNNQKEKEMEENSASANGNRSGSGSGSGSSINSTFTKTYSDSFIERILLEEKIDEPIEEIDQLSDDNSDECVQDKNNTSAQDEIKKEEEKNIKERLARQVRSLSEGAALVNQFTKDGDVIVFPNLQDTTLDALGLMASSSTSTNYQLTKEHLTLTEEEIEEKFQTLAFAFNIDAHTIKGRLEIQQRQRDQAEKNLNSEIVKFKGVLHRLLGNNGQQVVDTELVTGLLDRLQLILQATQRISTTAQILGSFQQEWRISESVNLMLTHLRNVIKQRDAARKQLQVTKRMLQESTTSTMTTTTMKKAGVTTTRRLTINTLPTTGVGAVGAGGKGIPPRRASIAVIPRLLDAPSTNGNTNIQVRRIAANVRRTSEAVYGERQEPLLRHWDCSFQKRAPLLVSRQSRIDIINPELSQIQEGSTESTNKSQDYDSQESQENEDTSTDDEYKTPTTIDNPLLLLTNTCTSNDNINFSNTTIKNLMKNCLKYYLQLAYGVLLEWAANGTLHEICFLGTIVCFAMATILLCNTFIEIELAREGVRQIPWKWLTWNEIASFFY